MTGTLLILGWTALVIGWVGIFLHWPQRHVAGLFAVANGLYAVANFAGGNRAWGTFASGTCAYCVYRWWNGGGGDGTKRRLRALRNRFAGVRRTAPAYGGTS